MALSRQCLISLFRFSLYLAPSPRVPLSICPFSRTNTRTPIIPIPLSLFFFSIFELSSLLSFNCVSRVNFNFNSISQAFSFGEIEIMSHKNFLLVFRAARKKNFLAAFAESILKKYSPEKETFFSILKALSEKVAKHNGWTAF